MNNEPPPATWLKFAAFTTLIGTVSFVLLILTVVSLGIADPKPVGQLVVDYKQGLDLTTDHIIYHSVLDTVHCPCTIEATLRLTSGASSGRYGLWWRTSNTRTVVALNGNAYYAIFDDTSDYLSEWQRFTWLLPRGETNIIRLDLTDDGSATLRLNDEISATFTWSSASPIEVGYYLESIEGTSTVNIQRFRIWSTGLAPIERTHFVSVESGQDHSKTNRYFGRYESFNVTVRLNTNFSGLESGSTLKYPIRSN